jgi:hypothetical protein
MAMSGLDPYAAMSLATIAYDEEGGTLAQQKAAMAADLATLPAAAEGPWSLVWGPAANDGILAFVALNAPRSRYAVAIRGSLSDVDAPGFIANWFDDFDALAQVPWLYPQSVTGALISSGMNSALSALIAATDPATDLTMIDHLRAALAGTGAQLMVTGHSLGGALTSLVAPWLYDQLPRTGTVTGVAITPHTFAAPTAGNAAFARYYDHIFPGAYRCVNTLDVVPMGYADVSGMQAMYPAPSQTLYAYSKVLWGVVESAKIYMEGAGIAYAQTNQNGAGTTDAFAGPALSKVSFATEAEAQHDHAVYLAHVTPAA